MRLLGLERRCSVLGQIKSSAKVKMLGSEVNVELSPTKRAPIQLKRAERKLYNENQVHVFPSGSVVNQWVYFEAPVGYGQVEDLAIFLDVDEPSPSYPNGGNIRLLLHGSAAHMTESGIPGVSAEGLSSEAAQYLSQHPDVCASSVNAFIRKLKQAMSLDVIEGQGDGWHTCKNWFRGERRIVHNLLVPLGRQLHLPYAAGWMSGFAMVTAVVPPGDGNTTVVFATPLFVERMSP